jgi:SAM-dependent methyltransferase
VSGAVIPEFHDPRLVAVYETVNAYGRGEQPDFYAGLASELGACRIVDLGCGTGLVTRALAGIGYEMIGVEPSAAMLAVARARPLGDRVRWIEGGADALGTVAADLAIMSGHVAQFFLTDDEWRAALLALRGAVRAGGSLAFESRNPLAREWERWTRAAAVIVHDAVAGAIETWTEVDDVADGIVSCTNHYCFLATGEEVVSRARLRFRSETELRTTLSEPGFTIDRCYGDWDRRPATATTRELVVVAS